MAVVGDEQIGMTVVIDVADAGRLRPTGARQSGLPADFGEVSRAIVAVELRMRGRPVGNEDVVGAVAIEVEDRHAGAGALEDGLFLILAAEGVGNGETRLRGDIDEANGRGFRGGGERTAG